MNASTWRHWLSRRWPSSVLAVGAALVVGWGAGRAQAPMQGPTQAPTTLTSGLVRADAATPTRGAWGEWRRHFRGPTRGTRDLVVLAVHLKPGQAPHPPHRHAEEEVMILTEGAGLWHLDGKELPARKGDVVYAAPWTMHGLKNTGDGPLTYYLVKWQSNDPAGPPDMEGHGALKSKNVRAPAANE